VEKRARISIVTRVVVVVVFVIEIVIVFVVILIVDVVVIDVTVMSVVVVAVGVLDRMSNRKDRSNDASSLGGSSVLSILIR
jgi:hypothetical protein